MSTSPGIQERQEWLQALGGFSRELADYGPGVVKQRPERVEPAGEASRSVTSLISPNELNAAEVGNAAPGTPAYLCSSSCPYQLASLYVTSPGRT